MNPKSKTSNGLDNSKSSVPLSLSENFHQQFRVQIADTKALRHAAFRIRHEVYCQEFGWEKTTADEMEIDEFDDYSYHCLLEHRASKLFAGCLRIVIPPPHAPATLLPFETQSLLRIKPEIIDVNKLRRGAFGEISRLSVPGSFRRRHNEANHPFVISNITGNYIFSPEERRHFPNIAIGLYLAALALVETLHHEAVFMMTEPKLHRRLVRFGFPFVKASEVIDHHGLRVLFYLPSSGFFSNLSPELLQLYEGISKQINQQILLLPYIEPTDR